jgi:NADPH2:quinone reductase
LQALTSIAVGGPDSLVITEMPDPVPGPGQVLLAVMACGVNFPDALIIEDRYQYHPERPFSPGAEVAGIVLQTAPDVAWPHIGDRVMAMTGWGGMAEKIALPAAACVAMPPSLSFDEAAGFILTYGTSYHALRQRAALQPGEKLLVLGAAGGVGLAAVELGRAFGAEVVAAVSSEAKLRIALDHGAHRGFIYPSDIPDDAARRALAAQIKAECGSGADVVYDAVGGALSEAATRAMAWRGRLLIVGFPAGIAKLPLNLLMLKGASAVGVFYGVFAEREPKVNAANNRELLKLVGQGALRPFISARYPLAQGGQAIADLLERRATGKLVIQIADQGVLPNGT